MTVVPGLGLTATVLATFRPIRREPVRGLRRRPYLAEDAADGYSSLQNRADLDATTPDVSNPTDRRSGSGGEKLRRSGSSSRVLPRSSAGAAVGRTRSAPETAVARSPSGHDQAFSDIGAAKLPH